MADLRLQYNEEIVGAGHPTKQDTVNRLALLAHDESGYHRSWADVSEYGSLSAVLDSINGTERTILISKEEIISSSLTVPANVTLEFLRGGFLNILNGHTVTINGDVSAGLYRVFTGDGSVVFGSTPIVEVRPEWWGAKGDGSNNDTLAIQMAISSACVISLAPNATYRITSALSVPSYRRIHGNGATIDMSGMTVSPYYAMAAAGTTGSSTLFTQDGVTGSYSVSVADASIFSAGQYVQVRANNYYPTDSAYLVNRGEIKKIRSVSGNTVYFTTALLDDYTAANQAAVQAINWTTDVYIDGVKVQGSNTAGRGERGICLRYVKDFAVTGCHLLDQDIYQIELSSCIMGKVTGNYLHGVFYDGYQGTIFYGIAVVDCTQWVEIAGNTGDRNRHLVVTVCKSAGQGYYGQPHFLNIHHNIMFDSESGGEGRSYAFECHEYGRFIVWDSNQAHGCYSGFNIENGWDNIVCNNIIRDYAYAGIVLGGNSRGLEFRDIMITNNEIARATGEIAGECYGIKANSTAGSRKNILIHGNKITDYYNPNLTYSHGIHFPAAGGGDANIIIKDNLIDAGNTTVTAGYGIYTDAEASEVSMNKVCRSANGIYIGGARSRVFGNLIDTGGQSTPTLGYGIYTKKDRVVIQSNTLNRVCLGTCIDTGGTNCVVKDNNYVYCTTSIYNNGTGTITTSGNTTI